MRKVIPIILTILLTSCTEKVMVEEHGHAIEFMAGSKPATKALLDPAAFRTAGTTLHIEDLYTLGATSTDYISSAVTSDGTSAIWPFVNNEHYYWTKTGSHRFFGWLQTDAYTDAAAQAAGTTAIPSTPADQTIPATWTYSAGTLSIPSHAIPLPQSPSEANYTWDFLYGKPLVRSMDVPNPDHSPVPLSFSHLYTAFAVCFKDDSPDDVILTEVSIEGLKNTASAAIDFCSTTTAASNEQVSWNEAVGTLGIGRGYADQPDCGGQVTYTVDPNSSLTYRRTGRFTVPGDRTTPHFVDLCNGDEHFSSRVAEVQNWHLMWPQSAGSLAEVTLTMKYTMHVSRPRERFNYVVPSVTDGSPRRGDYVVETATPRSGGPYKLHTGTLGRGSVSFSGTYYEFVGIGQGDYDVTFKKGTPSSTVCGYSLANETYTDESNVNYTAVIPLQREGVQSWEPGCRYYYLITHSDNAISLKVKVLKWEPHDETVPDFGTIYDENGNPVTGDDLDNLIDWK